MSKRRLSFFLLVFLLMGIHCSESNNFVVHHQVTGPTQTNSYLLFDVKSKEAALFDVGGPIDTLESVMKKNNLKLKYVFITHAHCDHVEGLPYIRENYPKTSICLSSEEYEDTKLYTRWEEVFDPNEVSEIKKYPDVVKMANFDYALMGKPGIFLKDNKIYKLGKLEIKTFLTPGHSRGSMCFYTGNVLFSGDVLFYRRVGRTDFPQSGGPEAIIKSVRRLYNQLPDETKVYPGHGQFTDIGSEKIWNEQVNINEIKEPKS